jgi:hypothetical protein
MNKKIIEEITNWGNEDQDFSHLLELIKNNVPEFSLSFNWDRNKNDKSNFILHFSIDASYVDGTMDIITAMLFNVHINSKMYYQWTKPNIFYFLFNPLDYGYYKSSEFVTKNNISRQYVNNSKHKFYTITVSPKIQYIKNK